MSDEVSDLSMAKSYVKKAVVRRLATSGDMQNRDYDKDNPEIKVPKSYWQDSVIQTKLEQTAQWVIDNDITPLELDGDDLDEEIEECVLFVAGEISRKSLKDTPQLLKRLADAQAEIKRLKHGTESSGQRNLVDALPPTEAEPEQLCEAEENTFDVVTLETFIPLHMNLAEMHRAIRVSEPVWENGTAEEMRAGVAAGNLLAQWLRRDRGVQQFRSEVLQGYIFPDNSQGHEAAWRFITSPLPQVLAARDYKERGLCPATTEGHLLPHLNGDDIFLKSGLKNRATSRRRDRAGRSIVVFEVEIDTEDGSVQRFCVEHDAESYCYIGLESFGFVMPLTPNVHFSKPTYKVPYRPPFFDKQPPKSLSFSTDGDTQTMLSQLNPPSFVEGYGECVVKQAMKVVNKLLTAFPVDVWQLITFLLTDGVPKVIPIQSLNSFYDYRVFDDDRSQNPISGFGADGGITLHVQPWVQPESLANHWRDLRGGKKHLPKEDALEKFTFALMNTKPDEDCRWQALANQWQEDGGRSLGDNPRDTFRKAVTGTRETLFPKFGKFGALPPDEI